MGIYRNKTGIVGISHDYRKMGFYKVCINHIIISVILYLMMQGTLFAEEREKVATLPFRIHAIEPLTHLKVGLQKMITNLMAGKAGIPILTISLGADADEDLMNEIAERTNGIHFNIPGGQTVQQYEDDLKDVFTLIAKDRPLKLVK